MATIALHLPAPYSHALAAAQEKWVGRQLRPIDRLRQTLASGPITALEFGLDLARRHRETLAHEP
jgi:hypothetical protein